MKKNNVTYTTKPELPEEQFLTLFGDLYDIRTFDIKHFRKETHTLV